MMLRTPFSGKISTVCYLQILLKKEPVVRVYKIKNLAGSIFTSCEEGICLFFMHINCNFDFES